MKRIVYVLPCVIFILFFLFETNPNNNDAFAKNSLQKELEVKFQIDDNFYSVNNAYIDGVELTNLQKTNLSLSKNDIIKNMVILNKAGFSKCIVLKYSLPYLYFRIDKIINSLLVKPQNAFLSSEINTCETKINFSQNGLNLDKNAIFEQIFDNITNNFTIKKFNRFLWKPDISTNDLNKFNFCRSCFLTNFSTSNNDRKCNIILALKKLNGTIVMPGEIFSFNHVVGERSEKNGFKKAKIIKNKKYIESFGGGVCQVSTTLYNAAIRAGLKIVELHPHSLRVGYVEPGFDAMVNMGSSDLKFINNTNCPILIATSFVNDVCKICIFGEKNPYVYEPYSVVTKDVNLSNKNYELLECVDSFLRVYNENGELIKDSRIRHIKYNNPVME